MRVWLLAFTILMVVSGEAQPEQSPAAAGAKDTESAAKSVPAQSAVIGPDGGTVFVSPDFDSKMIAQLPPGMKVSISRKVYPGAPGLGLFYRIRFGKDRLGYIADTEVIPEFQHGVKVKKNPVFGEVERMRDRVLTGREPISLTRYFGLSISQVDFTERFNGRELSSRTNLYGLRFSGPGVLFNGPPLDLNLNFSPKPPSFYRKLAQTPPSGFFLMADTSLLIPAFESESFVVYGGLGLGLIYTKFRVQLNFDYYDSQELRVGAVGTLGGAYRHKLFLARLDARYHYERAAYLAYTLSLQHEY